MGEERQALLLPARRREAPLVLGVAEPETHALLEAADGVQTMPAWGINHQEALDWKNASGEVLGNMVAKRLKVMQSLELTSGETTYAYISLSIGVLAWLNSKNSRSATQDIKTTLTENNGGGSVKDALDRIEEHLSRTDKRLTGIEKKLE